MATTTTPRRSKTAKSPKSEENEAAPAFVPVSELLGGDPLVEEPLLDLSLLDPVRPTVNLRSEKNPDGKLYELADMNDFALLEQHSLKSDGDLFLELWRKPHQDLTATEKKKMASLLEDLFQRALIVPDPDDDIRSRMKDGHKALVVLTFQNAPVARAMAQIKKQADQEAREGSTSAS